MEPVSPIRYDDGIMNAPIRAADFEIDPAMASTAGGIDAVYPVNREGLVLRLFRTLPDYRQAPIEQLREEVEAADPIDIFEYCRRQGVEVLNEDGTPVLPWRDIAVLLLARERNLLS